MSKEEMSFLEHLEELRWLIIRTLMYVSVFAGLAFIFNEIIFDKIILAPKNPWFFTNRHFCALAEKINAPSLCINSSPFQIININMAGQFSTHIRISFFTGIVLGFPLVLYELWRFIKPALYTNERKHASGAVFYSSLLFFMGILFGYYLITPLSVHFLGTYSVSKEVTNQINIDSYISTVTSVIFASGIIFELPVLVYFFTKVGLVSPEFLKKYRKHSVIVILIVAAIITPPDVFSQVLVSLPLLLLYEVGIVISRKVKEKEKLQAV